MRVLFLAKTRADFRCYAAQARILVDLLLEMGLEVDVYDYSTGVCYSQETQAKVDYNPSVGFKLFTHISRYLAFKKFFKQNRHEYDLLQVMYLRPEYFLLAKTIRQLAGRELICVYGSDVNTFGWYKRYFRQVFKEADFVSFTTTETLNSFVKQYKYAKGDNLVVNSFPIVKLASPDSNRAKHRESFRIKHGLDAETTIVVCGMSSFPNEQIEVIVDSIGSQWYDRCIFVFPLTYGLNQQKLEALSNHIKTRITKNRVIILQNYLTEEEVLDLRFSTDILINNRKKDQAGGAFIESLAAQSYVIAGSWLPYGFLEEQGVYFKTIDSSKVIADALAEGIKHMNMPEVKEKLRNNTLVLNANYSMEQTIIRWRSFYAHILSSLPANNGVDGKC